MGVDGVRLSGMCGSGGVCQVWVGMGVEVFSKFGWGGRPSNPLAWVETSCQGETEQDSNSTDDKHWLRNFICIQAYKVFVHIDSGILKKLYKFVVGDS